MLWKRLRLTLDMIKFEHSVFALPFALTGALLAFRDGGYIAAEIGGKLAWIAVAMIGARSAAMAFNRLVDASIDGRNPVLAATFSINCCFVILFEFSGLPGEACSALQTAAI